MYQSVHTWNRCGNIDNTHSWKNLGARLSTLNLPLISSQSTGFTSLTCLKPNSCSLSSNQFLPPGGQEQDHNLSMILGRQPPSFSICPVLKALHICMVSTGAPFPPPEAYFSSSNHITCHLNYCNNFRKCPLTACRALWSSPKGTRKAIELWNVASPNWEVPLV